MRWCVRIAAGFGALGVLVAIGAGDVGAQGWLMSASAGRIDHQAVEDRSGSITTTLGVTYGHAPGWLYLSGGFPIAEEGVAWGAAGAGARFVERRVLEAGLDLGIHGFTFRRGSDDVTGRGATLEGMPFLARERGRLRVELASGVHYYTSEAGEESVARPIHRSEARLRFTGSGTVLTAEGGYVRADDGDFEFVGAGIERQVGPLLVWGSAGTWLDEAIESPVWRLGGQLSAGWVGTLFAAVEQQTNDPLYRNTPRRTWNVGLARRLGAGRRQITVPVAEVDPGAGVTFRLPLSEAAEPPMIAGDFTGWAVVPMKQEGDEWVATLPLASGAYRYAFRRPDGGWFVPDDHPGRIDDGFGGSSAVILVP